VLDLDSFTSATNSSSNAENNTSSFPFPYVKPDPFPVLLQGPGESYSISQKLITVPWVPLL
jgi:hypothetical protein